MGTTASGLCNEDYDMRYSPLSFSLCVTDVLSRHLCCGVKAETPSEGKSPTNALKHQETAAWLQLREGALLSTGHEFSPALRPMRGHAIQTRNKDMFGIWRDVQHAAAAMRQLCGCQQPGSSCYFGVDIFLAFATNVEDALAAFRQQAFYGTARPTCGTVCGRGGLVLCKQLYSTNNNNYII
eukprot:6486494-Amphidinium_carterae.2